MRSCLIQLLIAVAVIFALLWFGLPFGASWLATNALTAAGFTGTDTKVTVSADLPPRILLGHADKIQLTATDASVGGLYAASIDVTLSDVELIDRTFASAHGTLKGVRVPAPNGDPATIDSVALDGAGTPRTRRCLCRSTKRKACGIADQIPDRDYSHGEAECAQHRDHHHQRARRAGPSGGAQRRTADGS